MTRGSTTWSTNVVWIGAVRLEVVWLENEWLGASWLEVAWIEAVWLKTKNSDIFRFREQDLVHFVYHPTNSP